MTAKNDITGDALKSRTNTKAYSDNYDAIFKNRNFDQDGYEQKKKDEKIANGVLIALFALCTTSITLETKLDFICLHIKCNTCST